MVNPIPPMYATSEALDRAVERLEAAMDRGFDKITADIDRITTVTGAHTGELALGAYRIGEIEKKAVAIVQQRWQLWGMVASFASVVAGGVSWIISHLRH